MNVRLLGVLLALVGLVFGVVSYKAETVAKTSIAGLEIQDYYRKVNGKVFREDLVGVKRYDLEHDRDSAHQHMIWGFILAAIGVAVALAAKGESPVVQPAERT